MQIEKRSLNWLPRASAYDEIKAAQAKRKEHADTFISQQQNFASSFSSLFSSNVAAEGDLVAQLASARLDIKA